MCLINGDVGGQLFAAHEFSTIYTTHKDGTITKDKIPIKTIIRDCIHTYAQEPYSNIVINDLESCGVELLDYTCDDSIMYIFEQRRGETEPWVSQICFSGSYMADLWEAEYASQNEQSWDIYKNVTQNDQTIHYHLLKRINPKEDPDTTAGYRATDLIYPQDLVVPIGGNIVTVLDNIVKMLGEFEYFYDIDGRFIFQKKKIYFNSSWSNAITTDGETYYDSIANNSAVAYNFLSGYLIDSFQNKPNLNAIRNDYSVWGKRKNASGTELTIHMRYAIDHRPTTYWSLIEQRLYMSNAYKYEIPTKYATDNQGNPLYNPDGSLQYTESITITGNYDWRELIYQMARDNLKATTMIRAITLALSKNYYHYDYYKMKIRGQNQKDFRGFYKYNDLTNKFEKLSKKQVAADADDSIIRESSVREPYFGQEEFEYCEEHNIPLFGPDKTLAHWVLTEEDIFDLNRKMQNGYYRDENNRQVWYFEDQNDNNRRFYFSKYSDYDYRTNGYSTKYYNIIYDGTKTVEERQEELRQLNNMKKQEDFFISQATTSNLIEDMRRELDEWSDTFKTGYDAYYADMLQFWPLLYRSENVIEFMYDENGKIQLDDSGQPAYSANTIKPAEWKRWCQNNYWNPDLMTYNPDTEMVQFKNPELLTFWFDFIEADQDPQVQQYAVDIIGRRSKSINDDKVKAIYFRDTPLLLFVSEDYTPVEGEENLAYVRINIVPPISNYFKISAQGKSAKSVMDSMLYDGTYYQESVTISSIPIYYLEPNVRIQVQDDTTGINGQYLVKSISIQLSHDGFMSITATRVAETIL